jgi:hypothetical protein
MTRFQQFSAAGCMRCAVVKKYMVKAELLKA